MMFVRGIWLVLTLGAFAGFIWSLGRLQTVRLALLHEAKLYGTVREGAASGAQTQRKAGWRAGVLALCCFAALGGLIGLSHLIF
ncbi:hypothetical protein [Phenylobacterium kunshanense]|uniref:Uncharacterized protein n=1 Tax=Phenylobacterium kunshanense TaxID=1445034 RepID=A0A328BJU7_9CAUL|nr:hypothetical protein [Phenylobacterium kunshanense]RAK67257.1 hypothetical protein DJ019_04820 [Phenylobacterium kunshanense]